MERRADGALSDVGEQLGDRGLESPPDARATDADAGPVAAVDGAPTYLTLAEVTPAMAPDVEHAFHPLAARNVNWFTVPTATRPRRCSPGRYRTPGDGATRHRGAGAPLRQPDARLRQQPDAPTATRRPAVRRRGGRVLSRSRISWRARGVEPRVHRGGATPCDAVGARPLGSLDTRARAIANGSAARAVATEAAWIADADGVKRDRLAALLRSEAPKIAQRGAVRVESGLVSDAVQSTRHVGRLVAENALGGRRRDGRARGQAPRRRRRRGGAGRPAAGARPRVLVRDGERVVRLDSGEWARFAVHAAGGSPTGPGNGTAYVRESEPVAFDVNGDGRPDRVGRNERLAFEVEATVGVVVPAGPRGVGDVGGDADEQSAGW